MKHPAAVLLTLALAWGSQAAEPLPLFDAHLHYNVEAAQGPYPLDHVLKLFRDNRITGILANSRPNDGTRALYEAKQKDVRVVPFIRPYIVQPDRYTWFNDPRIYALIEAEYQRGYYRGIGEFHLFGKDAKTEWVKKTVDFSVAHELFLHAHSDDEAVDILFAHNPKARIVWAHTGFTTPPETIEKYLQRYPNLWGELSYRYEISEGGRLKPAWRALFVKYPERFLIGSDTWVNERWAQYGEIMNGYRGWLAELPQDVAEKIAFRNAERLFGK
jgi:predicted TIM-barrel fold metal-dependent hydrolase